MTSNLGSMDILEGHQERAEALLHQTFKPEFLNRIDEIVYFHPLGKETQMKIVDKMLNELNKRLKEAYYSVSFSDSLKKLPHFPLSFSDKVRTRPCVGSSSRTRPLGRVLAMQPTRACGRASGQGMDEGALFL